MAEYPQLTRAGLDSAVSVTIDARGTTASELVVEVDLAMFDRLGIETITPAPTQETGGRRMVRLSFERPPSGPLTVTFAGRVPTQAMPETFTYSVRAYGRDERAHVQARTWVLP